MKKTPPEPRYALMDARALTGDIEDAVVFVVGTAEQMIQDANSGDFGEDCAIVDLQSNKVMWKWFCEGPYDNWWRLPVGEVKNGQNR